MVDAIMTAKAMKPLLSRAKEEPVSAAIGLTDTGEGVILLNKVAKPGQMLGLLRKNASSAKVKLVPSTLRFGRAEIDTAEESKLVKFIVNKEGSEKLRKGLQLIVRDIQFQRVVIEVDETLEQDGVEGGEGEGEGTGQDTSPHAQALDKLEQIVRLAIKKHGNDPVARQSLFQAVTALKTGRECLTRNDGAGALQQMKLASTALRQIDGGTGPGGTEPKPTTPWTRPEPRRPNGEQQVLDPPVGMGRKRHGLVPPVRQRERSDQVQHAVSRRLLTGEELMQRLEKKPGKDLLGGLFKRSTRFKAVLTALKPIDDFMNQSCEQIDTGSFEDAQRQMSEAGEKALAPLGVYQDKLETDHEQVATKAYKAEHGSPTHRKLLAALKQADMRKTRLQQDRKHLAEAIKSYQGGDLARTWELIKADPGFGRVKGKLTMGQALQLKSCGISFSDVDIDKLEDSSMDKAGSKEVFGSGGINSVSRLAYQDGTQKVFKPMQDDTGRAAVAFHSGIESGAPHFENRNIASSLVGKLLGAEVIPEATVGFHNGRAGLMMDLATGREPPWAASEFMKAPDPKKVPMLQQQLMDLEWCDMLSGQMDRHNKNYLVDMTTDPPKVTGIDNDLAFSPGTGRIEDMEKIPGYNGMPKPKLIDRKTFEKLTKLDFDKDVQPGLAGRLTEAEIKATRDRLDALRQHARSLDPAFIVDDWAAWRLELDSGEEITATQYLLLDKKSLFGRDFQSLGKLGL